MEFKFSYDETTKVITAQDVNFNVNPNGLGYLLYENMKKHGNKIAQIDAYTSEQDTYSSLLQRCVRTALKMQTLGVTEHDVIGICSVNTIQTIVPLVAGIMLGAKVASFDPTVSLFDIQFLMSQVLPRIIFSDADSELAIEMAAKSLNLKNTYIVVFEDSRKHLNYSDFISTTNKNETEFKPFIPSDIKSTAMVSFSSGTTGLPKGICLSQEYFMFNCRYMPNISVITILSSMNWVSANIVTISSLIHGCTNLIIKEFHPVQAWEFIIKYKVEVLYCIATGAILLYYNKPTEFENPLKCIMLGGVSISIEYLTKIKAALPTTKVIYTYGQTEIGTVCNPYDPRIENKPDSVGTPLPGYTYKIVDPESEKNLGPYQKGELRVKTKWCMNGYYLSDSSEAWDEEGFLKTGDILYYDNDFCFYVVDRLKAVFKYRGFQIIPDKLETLILSHPDVRACVVLGVPHDIDGNHPLAICIPVKGRNISPEDIESYVNERVDDRCKLRAGVVFTKRFPKTPSGKINRKELKIWYLEGLLPVID